MASHDREARKHGLVPSSDSMDDTWIRCFPRQRDPNGSIPSYKRNRLVVPAPESRVLENPIVLETNTLSPYGVYTVGYLSFFFSFYFLFIFSLFSFYFLFIFFFFFSFLFFFFSLFLFFLISLTSLLLSVS